MATGGIQPDRRRTVRPLRAWGLVALLALLAMVVSGCLSATVDVTVKSDRSGEVNVEVYPNSTLRTALAGIDVEAVLDGAFADVKGFEFENVVRDGNAGYRVHVPFDDYRQLADLLTEGRNVAGQQIALFSTFNLQELPDDGGWLLDATINPLGKVIAAAQAQEAGQTTKAMLEAAGRSGLGAGLDLSVALPGKVTSSNADETDRGTATWKLEKADSPTHLEMRTTPQPLFTQLQMAIGGAAAVVVLGVLLLGFNPRSGHRANRRQRRREKHMTFTGRPPSDTTWSRPSEPQRSPVGATATGPSEPPPLPPLSPMGMPAPSPDVDLSTPVLPPHLLPPHPLPPPADPWDHER